MPQRRKLTTVVAAGDHRESLEALRDRLAREIEDGQCCKACGGPVTSQTAPLAKQLADVLKALAALPSGKEKSIDDDLAERRAARRAQAGPSERAAGEGVAGRGRGRPGGSRRADPG